MVMEGIPYDVVGGTNFYSRMEIKDILAYLKTIDNGRDEVALRRIINIPKRGIGPATLDKLEDYAQLHDISLYEAMSRADDVMGLGKTAAKIRPFVHLIEDFRKRLREQLQEKPQEERLTVAELIREIVEEIDYSEYLQDYDDEGYEDRLLNVDELVNKAVGYQDTHEEPNLTEFLEEVALVAEIDNIDGNDDKVLLLTLHSAKGLEFPNVYLAGMEDGLFPSYMTIMSDNSEDVEEERRLAYVGITRAMNDLTLTYARMRMTRGETQYNPISRFVREIPAALLDNTLPAQRRQDGLFPDRETVFDPRPKAIIRPRVTAQADKPFIAKGIGGLNQIAGITKGAPTQAAGVLEYEEGDRVSHVKYGEGTVLKIENEPREYKVTVNFDRAGQKIMYASFAKLKRV